MAKFNSLIISFLSSSIVLLFKLIIFLYYYHYPRHLTILDSPLIYIQLYIYIYSLIFFFAKFKIPQNDEITDSILQFSIFKIFVIFAKKKNRV